MHIFDCFVITGMICYVNPQMLKLGSYKLDDCDIVLSLITIVDKIVIDLSLCKCNNRLHTQNKHLSIFFYRVLLIVNGRIPCSQQEIVSE